MLKDEVTSWRKSFTEETSDDDLVLMMHKQAECGPMHIAAKQELDARRESREQARHREAIAESQASRRLDKWALSVAVVALIVGGAGLWRSFLPAEPPHLSPASTSSAPADLPDPIPGTSANLSTPATPTQPQAPAMKPNEPPTNPTE